MEKYKKLLIIISLILTVTIITGFSYAFYIYQNNQIDNNTAKSDCFKLSFEDNNDITLQNAVPIDETTAIQMTPYRFTIKNICNHTTRYLITLEKLNDSSLDDKFIRVRLNDYTATLLSEFPDSNEYILNDNAINSKALYTEYLMANEEKSFNLWIWLDEDSTIEAAEKDFYSKIVITGKLIKDPYINISFNAGNGTVNPSMKQGLVDRNIGELPTPTKGDDVFIGWYTSDGKLVDENTTFNEDTELYARWRSDPIDLKLYLRSLNQDNTSVVQDDLSVDANMRYIGANPNNYILFSCNDEENPTIDTCELWRIIGVFNSGSFNDYDGELVKIVRSESIGAFMLDDRQTSGNNFWSDSNLDIVIKNNYPYTTNVLAQSVVWKDGATSYTDFDGIPMNLYTGERSDTKSGAYFYQTTYTGVVALPYASDFLLATSGDGTQNSRNYCINIATTSAPQNDYWKNNPDESLRGVCSNNSWLIRYSADNNLKIWTISSAKNNMNHMYCINPNYQVGSASISGTREKMDVLPSLYLKPNLTCMNCNDETAGTRTNPFIIKQQ